VGALHDHLITDERVPARPPHSTRDIKQGITNCAAHPQSARLFRTQHAYNPKNAIAALYDCAAGGAGTRACVRLAAVAPAKPHQRTHAIEYFVRHELTMAAQALAHPQTHARAGRGVAMSVAACDRTHACHRTPPRTRAAGPHRTLRIECSEHREHKRGRAEALHPRAPRHLEEEKCGGPELSLRGQNGEASSRNKA
jgi:hypothetical protein